MNVLYIIGNGLDISLGMKTDYQNFYDYYMSQPTLDPVILHLKESIKEGRYQTWADLEAGLGKYSGTFSSDKDFLKCLSELKAYLGLYIKEKYEQKSFIVDRNFVNDFYSPQNFLDDQVKVTFDSFVNVFPPGIASFDLNIVTFNYTHTIENIFDTIHAKLPSLLHLHGSLNDGIVMGVSDIKQIANEGFRYNRDVVEDFVKPQFNNACLNNHNSLFEGWIKKADMIVLYGTSLGETDRKWWQLIGSQLQKSERRLLIVFFAFDKDKDIVLHPNYKLRWTEEYKAFLLSRFDIPDEKKDLVLSRICVGINKKIFHLERRVKKVLQ